jgi:peptide/nickel transport system ATP-binding protein
MTINDLLPDTATRAEPRSSAVVDDVLRIDGLDITVNSGARTAVSGASLRVRRGETVGIVGESGSGKTLTCRAVLGVLAPGCAVAGGSINLEGRDIAHLSRSEWQSVRGRTIGAVFQDPASYLNPSISVGHQLAEALRTSGRISRRDAKTRAIELFAAVGLHRPEHVYKQLPAELSGGMLQRVLIAIAISGDPDLLVADEATTALDVTIQAEVIELLLRLRAERGLAVLFVSHDLAVISELCDRTVVFYAGEVVESGPTQEILRNPRHPYTRALLKVASVGDYSRRDLDVIPGQPPAVGEAITGCRFAARCDFAVDDCRRAAIPTIALTPDHDARCVRIDELVTVSQ